MCRTQELNLSNTQIGDAGVTALAQACAGGALAQVTTLSLARNQIGDAGLSALSDSCATGAMAQLTVSWRLTALSPSVEPWHAHSPGLTVLFDAICAICRCLSSRTTRSVTSA